MRTTLKRGVGRAAQMNGNGRSIYPPTAVPAVTHYEQPPARTGLGLVWRILIGLVLLIVAVAAGVGGGAYLWAHQTVTKIQAHTPAVVKAQKALDIPVANEPAIALVIGYDHRAGVEANRPSLSDTIMMIRADPQNKTISLLSFPRDLTVPIYCKPGVVYTTNRINSAYSFCGGPTGTLLTIKALTGLPVNYIITVNFHGFKEVVNKLGGVWMDVDRRYYNKNVGTSATDYANIDLQPGYQRLDGGQALEFVRFRHTDSDLYRVERQQEFVRSFREQIAQNFSASKVPALVNAMASNIEVAEGGHKVQLSDLEKYAFFAYGLPTGHVFQDQIENVVCGNQCFATPQDVAAAVQQFTNPDVSSSKAANAAALGKKLKLTTPAPSSVSVTVLNGNGVAGAAGNASYLLALRGYKVILPPNNLEPNAPALSFHTKVYFDKTQPQAKAAAVALAKLIAPADVAPLPARASAPRLRRLDPGSKLVIVLGQTFHGTIAPVVTHPPPVHVPAVVRADDVPGHSLLDPLVHKVPFKLEVPTVLERYSYPDTAPGDTPVRLYDIVAKKKAVRLVFRTGGNEYWGIEETNWDEAPALSDRSFRHDLGGREFDLYYSGSRLQMVVLHGNGATYWVVNTLRDSLSNETMLAIAKGLKPLTVKG